MDLKVPCQIIDGWQFGDIGEIDCKEGILRVLDGDRIVGGREGCIRSHWGEEKKKKEENTSKKIRLWYHVEVERGLLRNNDLTFPLIKNEYIYTKPKTQKLETNLELGNYNKSQKLQLITRIWK